MDGIEAKKIYSFINFHFQYVSDGFAAPQHFQRFRIESLSCAGFTKHFDVREKVHLHGSQSLSGANRTRADSLVEAET